MKFTELSKEEFRAFLKTQPLNDFVQAPEMEAIGKQHNWKSYYVGVKVDDNIVAASRIMARKSHFGKQNFYAPRGLILDYHNKELLAFFTKELKNSSSKNTDTFLRLIQLSSIKNEISMEISSKVGSIIKMS